jgi:chromosome segregation ATPase
MELLLTSIGVILFSLVVIAGAFFFLQKKILSNFQSQQKDFETKIKSEDTNLAAIIKSSSAYASRGQLDFLQKQIEDIKSEMVKEQDMLATIEKNLDIAQNSVEARESRQQELRSRSEDDEQAYEELLQHYNILSEQSIALDQKLAASLKRLDDLRENGEISEEESGALTDLSEVITQAGAKLRDLLTEYQKLSDRLSALKKQHHDLEEEYTKLVERQLGI